MHMKIMLAAISALLGAVLYGSGGVVSGLSEADVLTIRFQSVGCFHSYSKIYEISGGSTTTFSILDPKWRFLVGHRKQGSAALTQDEIQGLDSLFAFYRQGPSGGCTTVDEIEITLKRSGSILSKERFVDGSCSISLAEIAKNDARIRNEIPPERWSLLESIVPFEAIEARIKSDLTKR